MIGSAAAAVLILSCLVSPWGHWCIFCVVWVLKRQLFKNRVYASSIVNLSYIPPPTIL